MADPTILTCAVTGNITSVEHTRYLPRTPEQIAAASLLAKGVLATSNALLVEKAARIVRHLGGRLATPGEAREILRLKRQKPA